MLRSFFILILMMSFVYGKFPQNESETNRKNIAFDGSYPFDKRKLNVPPSVQKTRFKLNQKKKIVDKIQRDSEKSENILDGTLDIAVLQKPIVKALKTVDTLYLHPSFISTIIFPKSMTISTAGASFTTSLFSYSNNILLLQPSLGARNGNMVLSLTDGKQNYMITIFVKHYFKEVECKIKGSGYKCADDFLATIIKYTKNTEMTLNDKLQLIEDYLKLHKLERLDIFDNREYVVIQKNAETYYIVRDDEFGNIYKNGIALTVRKSIK